MNNYNIICREYNSHRNQNIGIAELIQALNRCDRREMALDVGCGNGMPIGSCLMEYGFKIVGIDVSKDMIVEFNKNIKTGHGVNIDILDYSADDKFDLIVSWGMIFHLRQEVQKEVINKLCGYLNNGGVFIFTSGNKYGECVGSMYGHEFTYYSLDREDYINCMAQNNCGLIFDGTDDHDNYYYCCKKTALTKK